MKEIAREWNRWLRRLYIYATNKLGNSFVVRRVDVTQEVTKRCRLSWLTNSTLVYESKCGRGGVGLRGLRQ
jgi:hypothetical protein